MKKLPLLLLLITLTLSSCATTPPALKGGTVKKKSQTLYYQTFLTEGMAGKKDKSGYKYKKKPNPLLSLISF